MGLKFLFCCDDCKREETQEVDYSAHEVWDFLVVESAESYPKGWRYDGRILCEKCSKAANPTKTAVSEEVAGHWGP